MNSHSTDGRPAVAPTGVPSKFYGIAAAGRTTVFVGDEHGEIAELISRHRCGRTVAVGDGAKLAQTVLDLAADKAACERMGRNARQAFQAAFDKPLVPPSWPVMPVMRAVLRGSHLSKPLLNQIVGLRPIAQRSHPTTWAGRCRSVDLAVARTGFSFMRLPLPRFQAARF